jgi:hypothetical protein
MAIQVNSPVPEFELPGTAVPRRSEERGWGCGKPHDHAGSPPNLGLEPDRATVPLHDGLAYGESQAEAAAVKARGEERFRNP